MLRLTVNTEEYLQIGENIKIIFLGGSRNHTRIMLELPDEVNVVRSKVIENAIDDPEEKKKLPHYHAEPELAQKYRKKKIVMNDSAKKKGKVEKEEQ
ncbi:MAG: carbon storage regulator [Bacillus sp. (in: Bacteria)]|nr:carbon storage regulator [Bacillus sp. (in: firmicutes)]MCM1425569.1 carbon storage regulator [Eubacterium sp.]